MFESAPKPAKGAPKGRAALRPVVGGRSNSDAELVQRALKGDSWAEEMLYRRHAAHLLGICTRLLRHSEEAEDAVQDAFVDAFAQIRSLRDPDRFQHWLTRIVVHKAHRRLRRRKLLRALGFWDATHEESLDACLSHGISPEVCAEIVCLDLALTRLPDKSRIAWQLRYVEGYRLEEIAEYCQCSLATAKRRVAEADTHVRDYVQLPEVSGA